MQQKGFGEGLGKYTSIRVLVGINSPLVREEEERWREGEGGEQEGEGKEEGVISRTRQREGGV